ncbi:hypothetical protein [Akkermansia muciniphila]|uniref:hypothetical protein n=1 Tax=Akkermansia muciniphila TaxID=239935 RepID=UPI001C062C78|nr:hypothetical protein [Akkermansia muciniphila]QWP04830.1 hypothetical protein J5W77_09255 [Akkermansia muciniphila]QWP25007.1 hypothetical protein J5W81_03620 [Akkermansia muciniphila]QWP28625.1 hypothetical protein J5W80_09295 [Akkermansia muciniphila]
MTTDRPAQRAATPLDEAIRPALEEQARHNIALQEQAEQEQPFIPLGMDSAGNLHYYVLQAESFISMSPDKHSRNNMIFLAPRPYWEANAGNGRGGVRWEDAARHCFTMTGNRKFTPDRTRGLGIWDGGKGVPVYNAGQDCYTLDASGHIVPCSNIADTGIIYTRTEAAPRLDAPPLTDEEGRLVMDYLAAVPFREEHGHLFMGGLLVSSILSGYLSFRPHCWINAPAESGKTDLRNTLLELTGNFSLSFEGAESTPAGVRQYLKGNAVPVLFDESEGKDNRRNLSNIQGHLDNARSATRGGVVLKGNVDGTGQSFPLRAGFMFFSVDNQLNRDSDLTRFIVLTLQKKTGLDVIPTLERIRTARAAMLAAVTPGKLIGRLLKEASAVRRNAETIKKALEDAGESGRRSELFGTILAGAWTLTHSGPVTPEYLEECKEIAASSRLALVEENDSERCLRTIIEYRDKNEGGLLLSELLLHGIPSGNENDQRSERQFREAAARNGVALKPEGGSPKTLFVACGHTAMKEIFKGTDWEGGNCKGALSNFEGVEFKKERLLSGTYRGVSIPLHLVFPDRFPPPEEPKDPDDTQNNGAKLPEPEPSRDVAEQEGTPFDDETEFSNNGTEWPSPVPETRPGHHGKPEEPPDRPPENDAGRHPPRNAVFQQPFFPGGKPPMNQPTNHKTEKTP